MTNPDTSEADVDDSTQTKTCTKCGETKLLSEFHKNSRAADGHTWQCKSCALAAAKENARQRTARAKIAPAETKVCLSCSVRMPSSEFHRRSVATDGLNTTCKACACRAMQQTRAADPEHARAINRAARQREDPAKRAARMKAWRSQNREAIAAYQRAYDVENAERVAAWKHAWYLANKALVLSHPSRHPEAARAKYARYRKRHPERVAEVNLRRHARKQAATVGPIGLGALWDGTCGICGDELQWDRKRPDPLSKSIDHIYPLSRGGSHTQNNLQWAHLICNMRKGNRVLEVPAHRVVEVAEGQHEHDQR